MSWMEETRERRADPRVLWGEVCSIVNVRHDYGPDEDPRDILKKKDRAGISVYARHRDYHDVIKGRLKELATRFAARAGEDVKVFVDTAPVMEKPLGAAAGLGWQESTPISSVKPSAPGCSWEACSRRQTWRSMPRARSLRLLPGLSRCLSDECLSSSLPD